MSADSVQAERERLEEEVRLGEGRIAFLLGLSDALRVLNDPRDMLTTAASLLGEHLQVNRVLYADMDGDEFVVRHSYLSGVAPFTERGLVSGFCAALTDSFRRGEVITVDDVRTDPRLSERERTILFANQVSAFAGVKIMNAGRWIGACGVHSATPRIWASAEVALIRDVAERTWDAFERSRAESALRLANQALRESEERFAVIHDRAPFAISLTSVADAKIVSVNEAFESLFEFSRDEVLGRTRVEMGISTPALNAIVVEALQRHGAVRDFEVSRRTKSGAERILLLSIDPVKIAGQDFLLTTALDVTEKKHAEAALREREQRLRLALEASAAGLWSRDAGATDVSWDDGFRRLYGISPDEPPMFDAWLSRVHEEDRPKIFGLLDELRHPTKNAWDIVFRIVRPDGSQSWIQSIGRADRDGEGQVTRLTGLDLDVTARHRAEEALRAKRDEEHDRELRLLLQTAAQGVVSVDAEGRILMANRAVESMFGWEPGELIGRPVDCLGLSSFRGVVRVDSPDAGIRKDGSTFPIEVNVNRVRTSDGGRAIAFVTDVTERRRAAAALEERTAELEQRTMQLRQLASDLTLAELNAREQLARNIHDGLQQLLVVAAVKIDQQMKEDVQRGRASDHLAQARHHLDEATTAARSLSFELYPPVLHGSGLPAALLWLAERMRSDYGLAVDVSADMKASFLRKDLRALLFESVRELLFNAVKHAGVDRVTVELALKPDDMIAITVSDQGVGFDAAELAARPGCGREGWGLFSIRERLLLLGGRFDMQSAPGRGSRFHLLVPRGSLQDAAATSELSRQASAPASPHDAGVPRAPALRILLVDDHAGVQRAYRELLGAQPELCVVGTAANGREAIAQARALRPDVVLMDILMPVMDGIEATRLIHAEFPATKILGLSTLSRTEDPHPIERAGAGGLFTKGIDTERLIDRLLAIHTANKVQPSFDRATG